MQSPKQQHIARLSNIKPYLLTTPTVALVLSYATLPNALAQQAAPSVSPSIPAGSSPPPSTNATDPASITADFHRATQAFRDSDFQTAELLFQSLVERCPHSELQVQCEYFACIAAWNRTPSPHNLDQIRKWLQKAREFERGLVAQSRTVRSQSWPKWVESAHLIWLKANLLKGGADECEHHLRLLTKTSSANATFASESTAHESTEHDPSLVYGIDAESLAWPTPVAATPQTWFELGEILFRKANSSLVLSSDGKEGLLKEALEYYRHALGLIEGETSQNASKPHETAANRSLDQQYLANAAKLALIRGMVALAQWPEASQQSDSIAQATLDAEQQVRFHLLQHSIAKHHQAQKDTLSESEVAQLSITPLQTALSVATSQDVSAHCMHELSLALANSELRDESITLSKALVVKYPEHAASIDARSRLARYYAEKGKWQDSHRWSTELIEQDCPAPIKNFAFYLKAKADTHLGQTEPAIETLSSLIEQDTLHPGLEPSVRADLSELLYQSERWDEMAPHLQWLQEHAKLLQVPPTWFPTILLRQAEMLASKHAWIEAEELVSEICENFPEWEKASEADYLLARCFVARAEFDPARKLLDRILHRSPDQVSSTLAARAGWMTAETYMMQRKYPEAVMCYQRVLSIPHEPYWHAASTFQIGQCAELCQDPEAAVEWYQKVLTDYADYPFAKNADERLKQLVSSSPKQAERIGSRKKR